MFLSGLLGAAQGVGKATDEIAGETRKKLAERLKLEAKAELDKQSDVRRHGFNKEIQATDIQSRKDLQAEEIRLRKDLSEDEKKAALQRLGMEIGARKEISGAEIGSREKIASEQRTSAEKIETWGNVSSEKIATERNQALKDIAKMENDMKERQLTQEQKQTYVKAFTEARRIIEGGGSTEEASSVLESAGLPGWEDYIIEQGDEGGLFGWGKKEPVMGRRVKSGTGTSDAGTGKGGAESSPVTPGGLGGKSELDRLLEEGRKSMPAPAVPTEKVKPEVKAEGLITGAQDTKPAPNENKDVSEAKQFLKQAGYDAAELAVMPAKKLFNLASRALDEAKVQMGSPGAQANIEAFKRSIKEVQDLLKEAGYGKYSPEETARKLAKDSGEPVEKITALDSTGLRRLLNYMLASQGEARESMGTPKPYGFK